MPLLGDGMAEEISVHRLKGARAAGVEAAPDVARVRNQVAQTGDFLHEADERRGAHGVEEALGAAAGDRR